MAQDFGVYLAASVEGLEGGYQKFQDCTSGRAPESFSKHGPKIAHIRIHMYHSLNSLKGGYIGDYIADHYGGY